MRDKCTFFNFYLLSLENVFTAICAHYHCFSLTLLLLHNMNSLCFIFVTFILQFCSCLKNSELDRTYGIFVEFANTGWEEQKAEFISLDFSKSHPFKWDQGVDSFRLQDSFPKIIREDTILQGGVVFMKGDSADNTLSMEFMWRSLSKNPGTVELKQVLLEPVNYERSGKHSRSFCYDGPIEANTAVTLASCPVTPVGHQL